MRAGDAERRGDVLVDGEVRVVDELLVDHRDRALAHRNAGHVLAVEEDAAFGRLVEPGHQPHQAGLARQRRPEQDVQRAVREGQRHVVDVRLVAHALGHVAELERHRAASAATAAGSRTRGARSSASIRRGARASLWLTRRPSLERRQSTSSAVRAHSCSHQIADLALGQVRAERLAPVGLALDAVDDLARARAVGAHEPRRACAGRQDGQARLQLVDLSGELRRPENRRPAAARLPSRACRASRSRARASRAPPRQAGGRW